MIKLGEETQVKTIRMSQLMDGQIAVVIADFNDYKGRVVQRYGNDAVALGLQSGNGWTDIQNNTLKVRLLEEGETLTIFDNE
jgi:hypothetical protein